MFVLLVFPWEVKSAPENTFKADISAPGEVTVESLLLINHPIATTDLFGSFCTMGQ